MKKSTLVLAAVVLSAFAVSAAHAKEVTLTGTGKCAKCSLAMTDECQNALVVKEGGKEQTYLLTKNEVSDKFHKNVCKSDKEIRVTGTVKDTGDKKEITPTKIELVKS